MMKNLDSLGSWVGLFCYNLDINLKERFWRDKAPTTLALPIDPDKEILLA